MTLKCGILIAVMFSLANRWAIPKWSKRRSRDQAANRSERRSDRDAGFWLTATWSRRLQTFRPYLPLPRKTAMIFWSSGFSGGGASCVGWDTTVCTALGGAAITLMSMN